MPRYISILIPMKTYMTMMFSTEGAKPSEVADRLSNIGFKPTTGNYDFVYEWDSHATVNEAVYFADKVHELLKGMDVTFRLETEVFDEEEGEPDIV